MKIEEGQTIERGAVSNVRVSIVKWLKEKGLAGKYADAYSLPYETSIEQDTVRVSFTIRDGYKAVCWIRFSLRPSGIVQYGTFNHHFVVHGHDYRMRHTTASGSVWMTFLSDTIETDNWVDVGKAAEAIAAIEATKRAWGGESA